MYKYIGTQKGEVTEGIIDGVDELDVKRKLQLQNIRPVSILPYKVKKKSSFSFGSFTRNKKLHQAD
ncbi:MAG: hypothetical protein PF495_04760, partial [Spirochaetales bacterium]|nr:hypothetical protein [Spirochaetales bacterium]